MNRVYPRHREENLFFYECAASLHVAYFILLHLLCTTSVLHMVAISLDRFVTVVFPLRHRNFIEGCGLKVMLIVSWSIPILAPALNYIVPPALFPGSFIKFLRMTTSAVSYFFICFFYFLSNSFGETDFPNGVSCCLHTSGRNGYVHCLLDSSNNCNGFLHGKTFSKTKHSSNQVAPNSGSVKLSHELSDLLC